MAVETILDNEEGIDESINGRVSHLEGLNIILVTMCSLKSLYKLTFTGKRLDTECKAYKLIRKEKVSGLSCKRLEFISHIAYTRFVVRPSLYFDKNLLSS